MGTLIAGVRPTGTQPGEHAGAWIAGTGDIDGNGLVNFYDINPFVALLAGQ